MKENVLLMRDARESLNGKWKTAVITTLVYIVIAAACGVIPVLGYVAAIAIGGPLFLGYLLFIISLKNDGENARLETLLSGFNQFGRAFITYLLMYIFIVLWMLLLIVPGIIMSIAYSMTFYIIADDPTISSYDAIKKSKEMMYGYKWKYFCLSLRFIGWALLATLTLGIGYLWLMPYMQTTFYNFYLDIKGKNKTQPEEIILEETIIIED